MSLADSTVEKTVMVSACLLGLKCRYDGTAKEVPELLPFLTGYRLLPFCPEQLGGLVTPRPPAEIQNGDGTSVLQGKARVVNRAGQDYTAEFVRGAEAVWRLVEQVKPELVVLKSKSPSCGVGWIYDGSFSGKLRAGYGVTAAKLYQAGIMIVTETELISK